MVKPGYKQTEIGEIPEEWEIVSLGEIANVKTGPFGSSLHAEDYVESGTPIITVEHLGESCISRQNLPLVSDEDKKRLSAYTLQTGDIVFSRVGSVDRNAFVTEAEDKWLFSGRLLRIRVSDTRCNPKYLSFFFKDTRVKSRVREIAVGQTMPSLNTKLLSSFPVYLPQILDQQRIAEALSDMDELIASLEKLIAKKKAIMQGAMQELLTGKRRLPGFAGEWNKTKIGDIGVFFSGLSGKKKKDFGCGKAKYITFLNVLTNIRIDLKMLEMVDVGPSEEQNAAKKGDLFFNTSSETPEEVGMCAALMEDVPDVYLNSFCFGFRLITDEQDPLFLSYFFNGHIGREMMRVLAQGATRYNLSKNSLAEEIVLLPSKMEQTEIAKTLTDIDSQINFLEQKLSKARQIKQGMMQQLLTGKTRLC